MKKKERKNGDKKESKNINREREQNGENEITNRDGKIKKVKSNGDI